MQFSSFAAFCFPTEDFHFIPRVVLTQNLNLKILRTPDLKLSNFVAEWLSLGRHLNIASYLNRCVMKPAPSVFTAPLMVNDSDIFYVS